MTNWSMITSSLSLELKKREIGICGGNNIMATFCINLNIHYSAPKKIWDRIEKFMPKCTLERFC